MTGSAGTTVSQPRRVAVLDHGSGNLRSVTRALARTGVEVVLTADVAEADAADGVVVPGVGAYAACMTGLRAIGGDELVRRRVAAGRPVLGICVGFQVLFTAGIEHGVRTEGVGVLTGEVNRLSVDRLPHMGWNTVTPGVGSHLFAPGAAERFYFVHSYGVSGPVTSTTTNQPVIISTARYGEEFAAAVEAGVLAGTQFHPEKSADTGAALLRRWVDQLA
ncbi:MAG: imidazole glycerol phosphate synthase subunit HisH [Propionibacteriales bacterium]|nr:imidazole glycerol phosphate synthase subunit HisH [Propionibacteriales bacterium]